ncbi:hypothetical protein RRG08_062084 [Elysia crispata]|uniref:Uncharacterized protein n=1 Tax=Elysia crispata TaxID=231223 RepID=A0AAE0ZHY7_9GAST|nr:hypothetical protein RRG08_062084 [Elysia crispata]
MHKYNRSGTEQQLRLEVSPSDGSRCDIHVLMRYARSTTNSLGLLPRYNETDKFDFGLVSNKVLTVMSQPLQLIIMFGQYLVDNKFSLLLATKVSGDQRLAHFGRRTALSGSPSLPGLTLGIVSYSMNEQQWQAHHDSIGRFGENTLMETRAQADSEEKSVLPHSRQDKLHDIHVIL